MLGCPDVDRRRTGGPEAQRRREEVKRRRREKRLAEQVWSRVRRAQIHTRVELFFLFCSVVGALSAVAK